MRGAAFADPLVDFGLERADFRFDAFEQFYLLHRSSPDAGMPHRRIVLLRSHLAIPPSVSVCDKFRWQVAEFARIQSTQTVPAVRFRGKRDL